MSSCAPKWDLAPERAVKEMINYIKRIFCKHEYRWQQKTMGGYIILGVQEYVYRCPKCGKIKEKKIEKY